MQRSGHGSFAATAFVALSALAGCGSYSAEFTRTEFAVISLPAPGGPAVAGPVAEPDQVWFDVAAKGAGIRQADGAYANRYSPYSGEFGVGAGLEHVELALHSSWTSAGSAVDAVDAAPPHRLAEIGRAHV